MVNIGEKINLERGKRIKAHEKPYKGRLFTLEFRAKLQHNYVKLIENQ